MISSPWVPDRGQVDPSPHACMYGANPEPGCGAPGTWHIQWDASRQSISCDTHMTVVQARWVYQDRHPLSADCGMPSARWLPNRCHVPTDPSAMSAEQDQPLARA